MSVHFPGRTGTQPIIRAAPREDRSIRLAQSSVVAVMRRHRRDAVRRLQWNDRPNGGERRFDADAEVDRQLICGRRAIDEDILPVEIYSAGTPRRIHLIQVAAELLRDTTTRDLCVYTCDGSCGDDHFVDIVGR